MRALGMGRWQWAVRPMYSGSPLCDNRSLSFLSRMISPSVKIRRLTLAGVATISCVVITIAQSATSASGAFDNAALFS